MSLEPAFGSCFERFRQFRGIAADGFLRSLFETGPYDFFRLFKNRANLLARKGGGDRWLYKR